MPEQNTSEDETVFVVKSGVHHADEVHESLVHTRHVSGVDDDDNRHPSAPDWIDHAVGYYLHAGRFMGAVIWPVIVGAMPAVCGVVGSTRTSGLRRCW